MNWTAPEVARTVEPSRGAASVRAADERTTLEGFLDWYRATLLRKCSGLSADQLALRAVPPSNLSLLGLVRHMTEVERSWFRRRFAGEDVAHVYVSDATDDAALDEVHPQTAQADFAAFAAELEACRAVAAGRALEETFVHPRAGEMTLRWIYVHMIEEYARHCGHADLLRERIDGTVGP
jgi:uncharacterized damage-inducible protein DinB